MTRETVHTLVGAAVILAVPILALVFFTGDLRTRDDDGYRLEGRFNRVDGLSIGTSVLLAGIPVGKVVALAFDAEAQQAVVTMSIRGRIKLPRDTAALIVSDGLLGSKFMKLEPGGDEAFLQPGDRFEYVQGSVIVEELLEKVILWAEARNRNDAKMTPPGRARDAVPADTAPVVGTEGKDGMR